MPRATTATTSDPAGPTARQKRDMAAVARAESIMRVPGTPYVVLSFDGDVDPQRLAEAADLLARRDKTPVILGGDGLTTAELMDDYTRDTAETVEGKQQQYAEFSSMLTAVDAFAADADTEALAPAEPDDDGGIDEDDDAVEGGDGPEADPDEVILAYLRERGTPAIPRDIARATGLPAVMVVTRLMGVLVPGGRAIEQGRTYTAA